MKYLPVERRLWKWMISVLYSVTDESLSEDSQVADADDEEKPIHDTKTVSKKKSKKNGESFTVVLIYSSTGSHTIDTIEYSSQITLIWNKKYFSKHA